MRGFELIFDNLLWFFSQNRLFVTKNLSQFTVQLRSRLFLWQPLDQDIGQKTMYYDGDRLTLYGRKLASNFFESIFDH